MLARFPILGHEMVNVHRLRDPCTIDKSSGLNRHDEISKETSYLCVPANPIRISQEETKVLETDAEGE